MSEDRPTYSVTITELHNGYWRADIDGAGEGRLSTFGTLRTLIGGDVRRILAYYTGVDSDAFDLDFFGSDRTLIGYSQMQQNGLVEHFGLAETRDSSEHTR